MKASKSSSASRPSAWIVAAVLVPSAVAGCQLLLPSGDDDTTSTANTGGAGSSSRDATSSGKTTGSMKSSSSGDIMSSSAADSTGLSASVGSSTGSESTAASTGASSSSGSGPCMSGGTCVGGFMSAMPTGCSATVSCVADDDCTAYCSATESLCASAYSSAASCCLACDLARKSKGDAGECCHVNAINELASGTVTGDSCTRAGAFGSSSNALGGGCGTQQANLCGLYLKLCPNVLVGCPQAQCLDYFEGEQPVMYAQDADPSHKLSHAMDLVLSGSGACPELVNLFCPVSTSISSSSTGP